MRESQDESEDREAEARTSIEQGAYAQALLILEASNDIDERTLYYLRGVANIGLGDVECALIDLAAARSVAPDDVYILHQMARARSAAGEFDEAIKLLREVVEKEPAVGSAVWRDLRKALDRYFNKLLTAAALEELAEYLEGVPDSWAELPEVIYAAGSLDLARALPKSAEEKFAACLKMEPHEPRFRHALGNVALAIGDGDTAISHFRHILGCTAQYDVSEQYARLVRNKRAREWEFAIVKPRHYLSICTTMKNEGEDVLEWMLYHECVGVQHFYIYLNDCTDDTEAQIAQFPNQKMITLHKVHGEFGQHRAYTHAIEYYADESEWCAFIDADEFIVPKSADSIVPILETINGASALVINWMNFGSNGYEVRPNGLCIENFTRRATDEFPDHYVIKSICRLNKIVHYTHPHHCVMLGRIVQPSGREVYPVSGRVEMVDVEAIQLNHYYTKSREQALRKRARGRPLAAGDPARIRDFEFFELRDRNDVEDLSAARFALTVRRLVPGACVGRG